MKIIVCFLFVFIFYNQAAGQISKSPDSCSFHLDIMSYFWKLDSLGRNGFRLYAYKQIIDCNTKDITQELLVDKFGKPNRITKDNLGSTYYGYYFFDGKAIPKSAGLSWELMYIFFRFDKDKRYVSYIGEAHLD